MKAGFPLTLPILHDVFRSWQAPLPAFGRETYGYEEFLREMVKPHPDLRPVAVDKERHGFTINGCIVEIADLKFDGRPIRTVAVEMETRRRSSGPSGSWGSKGSRTSTT